MLYRIIMNKKLVLIGALCLVSAIGLVYADNQKSLSLDGFNNCSIDQPDRVNCIGFNSLHNDNGDIKTLLLSQIQLEKNITEQNAQIIKLLTPLEKQNIQHVNQTIDGIKKDCIKSGTGILC